MSYEKPNAGQWVQPTPKGYKMACCDCGLVHLLDFRVVKYAQGKRTKVQFRAYRDNRATAAVRRGKALRERENGRREDALQPTSAGAGRRITRTSHSAGEKHGL